MNPHQVIHNPTAMPPLYTLLSLAKIDQSQSRAKFKILYYEHIYLGPLFYDEKDIVKKDVKRLPVELFNYLDVVYPPLTKNSFRSLTDDILRIITRFSLGTTQKLGTRVEYIQGMHELVGVSLYIALQQASGPTSPQASGRTEECAADAWAFANYLIGQLLDIYVDNAALLKFCGYVRQFIKELSPELHALTQTEYIPPFETFSQKSIFLFFSRDFAMSKISTVWVFLISAIKIYQQQINGPFELFPAFVLAEIFILRYSKKPKCGLESLYYVFLEQNQLFTDDNEREFMENCWSNFCQMVMGGKGCNLTKNMVLQQRTNPAEEEGYFTREKLIQLHKMNLALLKIVNDATAQAEQCQELDDVIICVYDKLYQAKFAAQQLLELEAVERVTARKPCELKELLMDSYKIKRNWQLLQPE